MKKSILLWGILSISLSLLLRVYLMVQYSINHEVGIDSFFYHIEANVLLKYHRFTWWLHPLSLIGLYPYSDSPGVPTYIAMLSSISGISVESCIFIYSILIVCFGVFSMYILILKITNNNFIVAFLTSFLFGIAPILILHTIWSIGERETLVYMIPTMVLWLFLAKLFNHRKRIAFLKFFFILSSYFLVLVTVHLMAIFLYGLFISLLLLKLMNVLKLTEVIDRSKNRLFLRIIFYIFISAGMFYLLFILNTFLMLPPGFSIKNYEKSAFLKGIDPLSILLNIAISYTGGIGILFIFLFPIGFLYAITKENKFYEKYFLWSLILSFPIIINRLYSRPIMVFLGLIFIGYALFYIFKSFKIKKEKFLKLLRICLVITFIVVSIVFTNFMIHHWIIQANQIAKVEQSLSTKSTTYEIGIYQKYVIPNIWISNNWYTAQRIQAYSNVPMQPSIVGSPLLNNPALYMLVNEKVLNIKKINNEFFIRSGMYYSTYYYNQSKDYIKFFNYPAGSKETHNIILKYNIHYIIYDTEVKDSFVLYHNLGVRHSLFLKTISNSFYKVYANNNFATYVVT